METIPVMALKPGLELGEDVKDHKGNVILRKNTVLDKHFIEKLQVNNISVVSIMEAEDYVSTYFEKIKISKTFSEFEKLYFANFTAYKVALESFIYKKVPMNNDDLLNIIRNISEPLDKSKHTMLDMLSVLRTDDKDFLFAHGLNVALICNYTAKWFGLDDEETKILILSGFYYDIGKFKLSDEIIRKPGKLTPEELVLMKSHPALGYSLIQNLNIDMNIKLATLMHHEKVDGSGYPQGLVDSRINKFAKIISILDSYEAMTSYRSYRLPLCPFKVIDIFEKDGLGKYDTDFYLTFLKRMVDEYIGKEVMLNDGTTCTVVLINQQNLSRPMVQAPDKYIDLSKEKHLYIQTLI